MDADSTSSPSLLNHYQYVGQLFLETRHQLELLSRRVEKAERERDEALRALAQAHKDAK